MPLVLANVYRCPSLTPTSLAAMQYFILFEMNQIALLEDKTCLSQQKLRDTAFSWEEWIHLVYFWFCNPADLLTMPKCYVMHLQHKSILCACTIGKTRYILTFFVFTKTCLLSAEFLI